MTEKRDITTTEAADLLGISRFSVNRLLAQGILTGRKVTNRMWLVNRASLKNYQPKRKRKPEPSN